MSQDACTFLQKTAGGFEKAKGEEQEDGAEGGRGKGKILGYGLTGADTSFSCQQEGGHGRVDAQGNLQGLSETTGANANLKGWLGEADIQRLNGRFFNGEEQAVIKPVVIFFSPLIKDS